MWAKGCFSVIWNSSEAGAFIVDKAKAFEQDLVLKVSAPSLEEIELLKPNSYIISALQINLREKEYFKKTF